MYAEVKKIQLIQELIKINDITPLKEIEKLLSNWNNKHNKRKTINDFVGVISDEESNCMKKAIANTSEKIHPDDWK